MPHVRGAVKIRIAIVNDQALFREGFIALTKSFAGLELMLEVKSCREFLERVSLSQDYTAPDVILIDIELLQLSKFRTTQYLHEKYPSTTIFVFNIPDNPVYERQLHSVYADYYFLKDSTMTEIVEAIYLHKRKPLPDNVSGSPLINLSQREIEVIQCLCQEFTSKQIAEKLCISPKTVGHHRENIQKKIGAFNIVGIIKFAIKNRLIE